ncbi:MarR family winged helix-turn-helix transcriptional regulator [Pedobacter antarcticus]|uniref:MarR family transcriptional regulator n=2 Tax=Pedobacter antarcticus TaxID=34086 RepID=A0A081PEE3_9SPHI|nr:MarR family transcriptional regulator [Pedobacter antarcticus]KEQ29066.1 MarR family transcriptional regulator [Pedobacter antarcticus 4BY]SDM53702.1 DNA-binding transcriptional regulator, MarR family [Pedobacter antarcticus]SFF45200.1 DNA-binding transcriptional regulator, MarR family [Pedobacter antarcticus]
MKQQETIDYLLKVVWQNMSNTYNQIASEFGITQAIGYMLINIDKEGTAVSQLAALLGVKATSLSRMLNNMEESGLIYREAAVGDKRSVKVFLTEFGREKRQLAKGVVRSFNDYLNKNLAIQEKNQLVQTLQKLNKLTLGYTVTTENDEQKSK